jgi:hypothetical protein
MRTWIKNTVLFLADVRFADWDTKEICGFATAECAQEFADLRLCGLTEKLRAHLYLLVKNHPRFFISKGLRDQLYLECPIAALQSLS